MACALTLILTPLFAPSALAAAARATDLVVQDLPELPLARDGAAVVATEDALYVLGGEGKDGPLTTLERLDLETGRWQTLTDELLPRRHAAAVLVEDTILIFGGRGARGPEAQVEAWDLSRGTLELRAPMPTPRYFASAALHRGQVYVAGGTMGWGRTDVVEIYDPAADAWYVCAPLAEARDTQLVVESGVLYALGGYTGEGVSVRVERHDGKRWVPAGQMPKPTSAFSTAVVSGRVLLFGDHREIGRVLSWTPATGAWRELRTASFPRRHSAAAVSGGAVYVVGGSQPAGLKLGTVERITLP